MKLVRLSAYTFDGIWNGRLEACTRRCRIIERSSIRHFSSLQTDLPSSASRLRSCAPLPPRTRTNFRQRSSQAKGRIGHQSRWLHITGADTTKLEQHQKNVENVAASVRSFYDRKEKFRIFHGSTNSTRKSAMLKDPRKVVDTSLLNHVVQVDSNALTALVEPNVPMDRLVEETLKHGLVPPVVMEFPGITVGGGFSGTSGESSSFKHGFFDRTLNSVEMVLANGDIVTASESQHTDLFRGAAGAVGTLGVTTMVELQLRKATKYVETTYHPVRGMEEAISKLQEFTSRPDEFDYIDGILFSPTSGAIVTGVMTDTADFPIQRFSAASDPWFYLHVQSHISKNASTPVTEAVPLPDYLFRYDRGGFWVGVAPFDYFSFPFNSFTRWWLDDFLHTRMLYNALHGSGKSEQMIIQDLALPYETAADFVQRMDQSYHIWPLWLCPLKQSPKPTIMHPHYEAYEEDGQSLKPMLNIGLWGRAPRGHEAFVAANRDIEATLQELHGMKWLYAQVYAAESDFWADFDKAAYDALREKYNATTLPSVYDKVRVDVETERKAVKDAGFWKRLGDVWPISGIYGLRRAIGSRDHLLARNATWKNWVPR